MVSEINRLSNSLLFLLSKIKKKDPELDRIHLFSTEYLAALYETLLPRRRENHRSREGRRRRSPFVHRVQRQASQPGISHQDGQLVACRQVRSSLLLGQESHTPIGSCA